MFKILISEDQIQRARKLYDFGELNGSIMGGRSNIYGAIGEIIVYDEFKGKFPVEFKQTYDYDMIFAGDVKIDVKSKRTTVKPLPHYNCSVSSFNTTQDCHMYIFCRVTEDLSTGYILGYKYVDDFYKESTYNARGEVDGDTGWKFKDNCYNLAISKLDNINW